MTTATATGTPSTATSEAPAPPAEMKCTLCGLSACWTKPEEERKED